MPLSVSGFTPPGSFPLLSGLALALVSGGAMLALRHPCHMLLFLLVPPLLALVLVQAAGQARARLALRAARRELEQRTLSDELTGLANDRNRDAFLAREFRRAVRLEGIISVLLIEIDQFAALHAYQGAAAANACLRAVAENLRQYSRRPGDLACRQEGGRFTLILEGDERAALFVAEALRGALAQLGLPHAANIARGGVATLSIGAASLLPGASHANAGALLQDAAALLYEAQRSGGNRVTTRANWPMDPHPPYLPREDERLALVDAALRRLRSRPSAALQALVVQAAALLQAPMSAISFVGHDRQFFAVRCGLDVEGAARDSSFCAHAITGELPLLVPDAARDARFSRNALVTGAPHIGFYVGAPIVSLFGNLPLGALCVMADEPRPAPDAAALAMLTRLAAQASTLIDQELAVLAAE